MPAQMEVIDITWAAVPPPPPDGTPTFTMPLGGKWVPNDWRIIVFCGALPESAFGYPTSYVSGAYVYAAQPAFPGWTALLTPAAGQIMPPNVYGRKLVAGDTDYEYSIVYPAGVFSGLANYNAWRDAGTFGQPSIFAFTVRGVDPTSTPIGASPTVTVTGSGPPTFAGTWSIPSRSLGAVPGYELALMGTPFGSPQTPAGGWTTLWSNGYAFATAVGPSNAAAGNGLITKKYTSGSTSGAMTVNFPEGYVNTAPPFPFKNGYSPTNPVFLYFKQAPDVTVSTGTAVAETDLANAATATLGSSIIVATGTAAGETDLANGASNGLTGFFVRDPYILGAGPVMDSSVRWVETSVPGRSSVLIESSLDRGVTWSTVTNGGPVPGLRKGNTSVDAVYLRGTLTRLTTADAMPKVAFFEPHIPMDGGRNELVPTGTFQIKTSDITAGMDANAGGSSGSSSGVVSIGGGQTGGGRSITMKGSDLSRTIDLAGWNQPYFVASGTNYNDAGIAMVKDRLPTQTKFDVASTTATTPLLLYGVTPGAKPWKDIDELYMALGWWAFFRPDGTFRACPVPDPSRGLPVWEYRDNVSISGITKSLTDQDFYNHIIVNGLATSPESGQPVVPIRAEAVDLDPVTGIYGKAGRRTYEVTLPAITSQPMGQTAADALLLRMKGCPELVTLTIPPNPLLEPGDVIAVTARIVKASGNYVINGFDIPAGLRGQRVSCFRQSIAS